MVLLIEFFQKGPPTWWIFFELSEEVYFAVRMPNHTRMFCKGGGPNYRLAYSSLTLIQYRMVPPSYKLAYKPH